MNRKRKRMASDLLSPVELLARWGYTPDIPDGHRLFVKSTDAALRTRHGFQWPMSGVVECSTATPHHNPCPLFEGDGLSLAKTWAGAALGGHRLSTVLLVSAAPEDVCAEDAAKVRVAACTVHYVVDWQREARTKGAHGADLKGARLTGADLKGARLTGADLKGADLKGANLTWADLNGASLTDEQKAEGIQQ